MSRPNRLKKKQYSVWIGGKQYRQRFYSAEVARKWQRDMRVNYEKEQAGVIRPFQPMGIEEAARLFLAQRQHLKSSDHDEYRMDEYVLTAFPGREVHAILRDEWAILLGDGRAKKVGTLCTTHKLSPRTSNLVRTLVGSFYAYCIETLKCARDNPIKQIKQLKVADKAVPFLQNKAQIAAYLDAMKNDKYYPGQAYVFAMLSLNTGQRLSQVTGLRWEDIDFDGGVIWFKWKWDYKEKRYVEGSKKNDGQHHATGLNESLRSALLAWKAKSPFISKADFVLAVEKEKSLTLKQVFDCNKRAFVSLKLPHQKIHALRHTFATHFLEAGGNVYDLKEILDHSTVTVTERYKQLNRERHKKVAAIFETGRDEEGTVKRLRAISD